MSSFSVKWWNLRKWFDSRRILVTTETQRAVLVIVAIAVAVFLSGTFMGVNSLQSVWAKQGYYESRCNGQDTSKDPPILVLPDANCEKQAMKLLELSHVAPGATYPLLTITGILTDWQGARRVFVGVVLLLALGNLIAVIPTYWTQFIGTVIMSATGPCLAFTLLVWAQLAPGWTRWIVSIIAASIPGGSFFLGTLRYAYFSHIPVSAFFAVWLLVSIPAIYLFIIWPRGIGKPYAASHPLLMLSYFNIFKWIFRKLRIKLPDDADHAAMVELEEVYSDKSVTPEPGPQADEMQVALDDAEILATKMNVTDSMPAPSPTRPEVAGDAENAAIVELESPVTDIEKGEDKMKEFHWFDQLNSISIILLQAYFLLTSVWLAVVSTPVGGYRMTYWAQKAGGSNAAQVSANIQQAKDFLPSLEVLNVVSVLAAPFAAIAMKSVGVAGLGLIIHIITTIAAILCLVNDFQIQILTFHLFPIVRGLLYPFALMFLIQTCGRRHLGLLWALTLGGAGPTDFIRTLLIKFWLYRSYAWDVLNGAQLIIVAICWIWPVYLWVKRNTWIEEHPEPLS